MKYSYILVLFGLVMASSMVSADAGSRSGCLNNIKQLTAPGAQNGADSNNSGAACKLLDKVLAPVEPQSGQDDGRSSGANGTKSTRPYGATSEYTGVFRMPVVAVKE